MIKRGRIFLFVVALLFCAVISSQAVAQLTRGTISGTVRDVTKAVVPGAEVTITNLATNQERKTVTNDAGLYRVTALEPSRYSVVVEMLGFMRVENRGIDVRTAQEVTFDVELKVAEVAATVDVTAQAQGVALNKTNPTLGLTATARQAVDLPLGAARNINNLALLSPNVFTAPGSTGISANGQRARNNNFTIDGSDNNDISVTLSTTPTVPEAVAEFQVQTNAYSAEFGRNSGAQMNVITRSGSNAFHGDLFHYYSGSGLNAWDNIEKGRNAKTRFNRNQYGVGVGGPIIKDKTFFFALFQGNKQTSAGTLGATFRMPTKAGFNALESLPLRSGQSAESRQAILSSLAFLNEMYAQNPVFGNISNVTVNGVPIETGTTNFGRTRPNNTRYQIVRVDHILSERDNLTFRYTYNDPVDKNLTSNTQFGSLFAADQLVKDQNLAISETHVFTNRLVNEFRVSYIRRNLQFPENDPFTPTTIIGGMFTIGGLNNFPQGRVQNSFQYSDILSYQRGRHSLKVGADIRRIQLNNLAAFDSKGTFRFDNLQDFMNNTARSFDQALQTASFAARQTQQFYFFQDDFRVRPGLTLNLGVRYETSGVPLGYFNATDAESLSALVPPPPPRDKNNWAPRVGFAYSPQSTDGILGKILGGPRSVIRGGYGIAYDVLFYNILTVNASNYPRVVVGRLDNAVDLFPRLSPVAGAPVFNPLATWVNVPADASTPYSQLFSLSVQRELHQSLVLEIGYTGSRSLNQINQLQGNPAILTAQQAATVRETKSATSIPSVQARRQQPQFGSRVIIGTSAQATYHAGFLQLNKKFSRGMQFGSAYTFGKLMSNNDESLGVADITAGSPQVPQDYMNIGVEKSLSVFDRTHRWVTNYIYEVPWFRGGVAQAPVIRHIFSGWQISGWTTFQSGQPFTMLTGVDSNGNGAGGDRPNLVPGGSFTLDPETKNLRTFTTSLQDGRFFVPLGTNNLPLANSLGNGNLGRNTFRAPGFTGTNLSVSKRFSVREGQRLTVRADMMNAFNGDFYGTPVNTMNSASFGKNTNNWGNRSIVLGAKYNF
jgi:hypothetical protein